VLPLLAIVYRNPFATGLWLITRNRDDAKILTKGDHNPTDDTELYAYGQDYLERKDILGSVIAYIPFVGYITIMLSEHPWIKTAMLGIMGLFVVLQRG
jgi:signal peptidase I